MLIDYSIHAQTYTEIYIKNSSVVTQLKFYLMVDDTKIHKFNGYKWISGTIILG